MRRVVYITGASGALGADLAHRLRDTPGIAPVAVSRAACPAPVPTRRVAAYAPADWREPGDADAAIVHAAGLARPGSGFADFADLSRRHIAPHLAMLDDLIAGGWRGRLVFVSSAAVYGEPRRLPVPESAPCNPLNAYGLSKLCLERSLAERAVQAGLRVATLRLSNLYGARYPARSGRGVIDLIRAAIAEDRAFGVHGDGAALRDYLHAADLAAAVQAAIAADLPAGASVFNVGSGTGTALIDLVDAVARAEGRAPALTRLPPRAEARSSILDIARARRRLDWRPRVSLAEGLADLPQLPVARPLR